MIFYVSGETDINTESVASLCDVQIKATINWSNYNATDINTDYQTLDRNLVFFY